MRRRYIGAGLFVAVVTLAAVALARSEAGQRAWDRVVWRAMVAFKLPVQPVDDFHIVVRKAEHRLFLYEGERLLRVYRVALSSRGSGPRRTWADELTPEGTFRVASMQYESAFGPRQMLLETTAQSLADYEAEYGAEGTRRIRAWEARHARLDTIWEVYDFNKAYPEAQIWNDILIHGGGSDRDWTLGCIALDNADLLELFDLLHRSRGRGLGVPVTLVP